MNADQVNGEVDPMDRLLSGALEAFSESGIPDRFRERLFAATTRHLRRVRTLRRAAVAGLILTAFAVGVGVGSLDGSPAVRPEVAPAPAEPDPQPRSEGLASKFKTRGDRFLLEEGNVADALHNYRQYLELLRLEREPSPEPGDTWLLTALKSERK
jgi:hypothetical protein